MGEREKKSGGVGCFIVGVIGFMLPVLYMLGFGPAGLGCKRLPRDAGFRNDGLLSCWPRWRNFPTTWARPRVVSRLLAISFAPPASRRARLG